MTSRNYDVILKVANAASFRSGNTLISNASLTAGYISYVDTANNILKVKLSNTQQEFGVGELLFSNVSTVTGTANRAKNTMSIPFQANVYNNSVTTASSTIVSITPSSFIAEKNAFTQNPIVRLYSIYYPGEWYPPNEAGNPTGQGTGYAWPSVFPIRIAEIVGDLTEDSSYEVSYDGVNYKPYPVNVSGLEQASDGKVNELSLSVFNVDNFISVLVENPYIAGINTSNSVSGYVNGEQVSGLDPRTIPGPSYDAGIAGYYGKDNAPFDKIMTDSLGGVWQAQKTDTRDLLGGVVEIKTTFANFLDVWPEYSLVSSSLSNSITVLNSVAYRVGDTISTGNSKFCNTTIQYINDDTLTVSRPLVPYLPVSNVEASLTGIFLRNTTGLSIFTIGVNSDKVTKYNMSTAYDITTGSVADSVSILAQDTSSTGVYFSSNGLFMYVSGTTTSKINQYTLPSAYTLTGATNTANIYVGDRDTAPQTVTFSANGSNLYFVGTNSGRLFQYGLSTPWNITTATHTANISLAAQDTAPRDVIFKPDGLKMYILGSVNDKVYQYNLSSAYNVATATISANSYVGNYDIFCTGMSLNSSGNTLYLAGSTADAIYQIPLATAWDISTLGASYSTAVDTPLYIANPLADNQSYLEDKYKIDQLEGLSEQVASFGLVSWLQYFKIVTPKRKYYKNTCQWHYKGPECQYPGFGELPIPGTTLVSNANPIAANNMAMPTTVGGMPNNSADVCAKSLTACTLRNNSLHYGGFPGVGRTVPQM